MAKKEKETTEEVVVLENLTDETTDNQVVDQDPGNKTRAYRG